MLYQMIVAAGLACFMFNLIMNLKNLKRPDVGAAIPSPAPLVSILVPARNEESNIKACLASIQKQDYPNFEVLVLNDNSSDNTASIVKSIAANDKRVRLIDGEPLPEDWAGKPFACHQLAREAKGAWLLFTDADTAHAPGMLRSALATSIKFRLSLLSGFPQQLANSLPQKVAIPVLYFVILSWLPIWWIQRPGSSKPTLAIGQFLFFPKQEYTRIGGHEAVKSRILEDVWLGIEVKKHGGRHMAIDLSPVVSCNMYSNVGAMWEGFLKWIYSVTALSPLALIGLIVAAYVFFMAPFYWLWNELFIMGPPAEWRALLISQVSVIFLMRWLVDSRFKEPAISAVLHPFGFAFLFMSAIFGFLRYVMGAGVQWKRRVYGKESAVQ